MPAFDNITIIWLSALLLTLIAVLVLNPFFLWKWTFRRWAAQYVETEETGQQGNASSELPSLSIVVPVLSKVPQLDITLPLLLQQDYPDFEIIVVHHAEDNYTKDLLKQIGDNPHLYSTFVPHSSRYMSRRKLAVTIGVKAAHNELVMLMDDSDCPDSNQWLRTLARSMSPDMSLLLGYSNYTSDAPSFWRFERMYRQCRMQNAATFHTAWGAAGGNLVFHKSTFMRENGYQGNLMLIYGEKDFIVNKYAEPESTCLCLSPQAALREFAPTTKEWWQEQVSRIPSKKHLQHSFMRRTGYILETSLLHLTLLFQLVSIILGVLWANWYMLGTALLCLLITWGVRTWLCYAPVRHFGENISPMLLFPLELRLLWHDCAVAIRYRFSDKLDFTSHKL